MNYGHFKARIQDLIDDDSDETAVKLSRHINSAYVGMASEHIWENLIGYESAQGTVLPSDLQWVVYVEDNTDYLYFRRGIPQRYSSPRLYNFFANTSTVTPLLTVADGIVAANGTALTSATGGFTTAMVGEYVKIGDNLGRYEISAYVDTNGVTLSKGYRGDAETAAHVEVRPTGTKAIAFTDDEGAVITSSTIKMWYLQKPIPLYNDYDEILLPGSCEALFIKTLQTMMIGDKYDTDARKLDATYQDELAKMKQLSPPPDRFVMPRGANDQRFMFGRHRNSVSRSIHCLDIK